MTNPTITVLGQNILVVRDPSDTVSEGGIEIPKESQTRKKTGTIKHVGFNVGRNLGVGVADMRPGEVLDEHLREFEQKTLTVGARVLWVFDHLQEVAIGDQVYLVMTPEDVVCVLE